MFFVPSLQRKWLTIIEPKKKQDMIIQPNHGLLNVSRMRFGVITTNLKR